MVSETPKPSELQPGDKQAFDGNIVEQEKFIQSSKRMPDVKGVDSSLCDSFISKENSFKDDKEELPLKDINDLGQA